MHYFYWDTSAFIKRFLPEAGTPVANHLFGRVPLNRMLSASVTMGELVSIVVRQRNAGRIPEELSADVMLEIEQSAIDHPEFNWLDTAYDDSRRSLSLILDHSINATDALVLRSALDVNTITQQIGDTLVLVASDARLVRAARAEGLTVFNPETDTEEQLDALLAG